MKQVTELPRPRKRRKPGPPLPPNWQKVYLEQVRKLGLYTLAAERAGIDPRTAERYRALHPEFDQACQRARFTKREELEETLVDIAIKANNPIGLLARLKAMGATEYIEQHLVRQLSLTVNADIAAHPEQVEALLRGMLADATEPTRKMLAGPPTPTVVIPAVASDPQLLPPSDPFD